MNRSLFDKWLGFGAIVAVLLLIVDVGLTYHNTQRLNQDALWVTHSQEVIRSLDNVLSLVKDAETGQRGYLITGEARYLEPYNNAAAALNRQVDQFAQLTTDNQKHQARVLQLRDLIGRKLDELSRTIALRRNGSFEDARQVVLTDQGKSEMDAIRAFVGAMEQDEQDLASQRAAQRDRTFHVAILEGLLSGVCAIVAVAALFLLYRRHLHARQHSMFIIAEQGERLRTTLASIGDGVIATDTQGCVTLMNAVAENLTGWTIADAKGQPLTRVFHIVNEETRREVENPALRALREGVIVGLANHTVLISKDGTERPIDDSAAPIRCAMNELVGSVLVFRDISDRVLAEQSQRESQEFNRSVMEGSPDCIKVLDLNGRLLHMNGPGMCAMEIDDFGPMCGQAWSTLWPVDATADIERAMASALGGTAHSFQAFCPTAKGTPRWWDVTVSPVRNTPTGRIVRLLSVSRDITERRRVEENLRIAKETAEIASTAKDNFLATLSHELRTPLTPVLATLGSWENSKQFPPEMQEDLTMIRRNIDLEARLIDDLLDLTRIIKGKLVLHLEVLDVQSLLHSVIDMYQSEARAKRIDVSVEPGAERCHVRGDPGRLQQAFWNLLKNAVKFTPEGGRIQIQTRNDAHGHIQILVQDNGIGIDGEMLARLFTPFEQQVPGRYGGLGLGLAITKTLLNAQGGEIEAQSDGPSRGATFIITLPCVEEPDPNESHYATSAPARTDSKSDGHENCYRILLVEDHADTARVIARLLIKNGHEVTVAGSVANALATLRDGKFDILLSDIGLPDGTGIDLIRQVRQQNGQSLPAIALTGFGMEDDIARCKEAGFNLHLTKPVNFVRLEQTIQEVCKGDKGIDCPD